MLPARNTFISGAFAALCLASLGCSSSPEPEEADWFSAEGVARQQLVADGWSLFGTWKRRETNTDLDMLVLMNDSRFHSTGFISSCDSPVCDAAPYVRDGRFKLFERGGITHIELISAMPPFVLERYQYTLVDDGVLHLRSLLKGSDWIVLERSDPAWCATSMDCRAQDLPQPGPCAGKYVCGKNQCDLVCGSGAPPD